MYDGLLSKKARPSVALAHPSADMAARVALVLAPRLARHSSALLPAKMSR